MTIAGTTIPLFHLAVGAVALLWILALLVAAVSWERKPHGTFRRADVFALVATLLFGATWAYVFLRAPAARAASAKARTAKASCASVALGDDLAQVKSRLGEPDEIRPEDETRGPRTKVWIYRDVRCAVHFLGESVESVE